MISLQNTEPALSPSVTVQSSAEGICRTTAVTASELACVEQELDDVIRDLGRAMTRAYADGDPTGARMFLTRQLEAIASRTPEHQARLTAAVDARIDHYTKTP